MAENVLRNNNVVIDLSNWQRAFEIVMDGYPEIVQKFVHAAANRWLDLNR